MDFDDTKLMTARSDTSRRPFYGFGLGLRPIYVEEILQTQPAVDWFEIITENYLVPGGKPLSVLSRIRERYPVAMHGVSLGIGGSDKLNHDYLRQVKALADRVEPMWVSDHLCWTGVADQQLHDLLPLPYTEEAVAHVVDRIRQVQDVLQRQILLENVSSYVSFTHSTMSEWEFLSAIAELADCLLLFDVNNVYVSARNHGYDPMQFLAGVPAARVWQLHVAGHSDYGSYLIDTHDHPVCDPVWELLAEAFSLFGPVTGMIERDDRFPPLAELLAEVNILRRISTANAGIAA